MSHLETPAEAAPAEPQTGTITYLEAIRAALRDAMREDPRSSCSARTSAHFGGAFGVTAGLFEEFGEERVIDTPIAEEGFVGAAIGAAWMGERPVVELQFADFITCAFDPIVTVAAKTHWRSGQQLPITIRCPTGGGVRGGPFHAGSPEGWFVGTAGLKIVCPGTVADAYGLLRAAIDDPDPVLFFEHKRALPARCGRAPPDAGHRTPIGPAARRPRRAPTRRSSPTAPASRLALAAAERVDADVEVVDLRTVWPLDERDDPRLGREDLARPRAAGGVPLDRRGRRDPLADRPRGRSSSSTRRPRCMRRRIRPCRSRPSSRTPTCHPSTRPSPPSRSCLPIDADRAVRRAPVDRADERLALFRLVLLQRLFEDRDHGALPPGPHSRLASTPAAARRRSRPARGLALGPDDVVAPLNRELACHFARGSPSPTCFATSSARPRARRSGATATCTSARPSSGVFPLVSMLGDLVPVVAGAALAFKRRGEPRVAMTFLGEGASRSATRTRGSTSPAVWQVPAVFVIQSNRYSYSTPVARQMVQHEHRAADLRRLVDPRRPRRRHGRARRVRRRCAPPSSGRGTATGPQAVEALSVRMHGPRRARRRALRARRAARGVRRALRPGRAARRAARARRLQRRRDRRDARRGRGRGRRRPRRGRERRRRPTRPRSRTASTRRRSRDRLHARAGGRGAAPQDAGVRARRRAAVRRRERAA